MADLPVLPDFEVISRSHTDLSRSHADLSRELRRCENLPALQEGSQILQAIQEFRDEMRAMREEIREIRVEIRETRVETQGLRVETREMREEIRETKNSVTISNENSIARLHNSQIISPEQPLMALRSVLSDEPIPHFPTSTNDLQHLTSQSTSDIKQNLNPSWPDAFLVLRHPNDPVDRHDAKVELATPSYLTDPAQIADVKMLFRRIQPLVCPGEHEQAIQEYHTMTILSVSCFDTLFDMQETTILVARAMRALELGQSQFRPAALTGHVSAPDDYIAQFSTRLTDVPPLPSPGWGPLTWIRVEMTIGRRPPLKIRIQSVMPNFDQWYSRWAQQALVGVITPFEQEVVDKESPARPFIHTRPPHNIRLKLMLVQEAPPGLFRVEDEIRALRILLGVFLEREARNVVMSISLGGIYVAIAYLDFLTPPQALTVAGKSTKIFTVPATSNGTTGNQSALLFLPVSESGPIRKLSDYVADGNTSVLQG
ncbi:MAG: hypothetical protein Q9178_001916 [Gyalolechia marmorata]